MQQAAPQETAMTAHLRRALTPLNFARKYPRPHVLIGGFDPAHVIVDGEPSRLDVLSTVLGGLGIVGEYSAAENAPTATLNFWFARGEDAARLCAFVKAIPRPSYGESITTACFTYDRLFHERFKPAVWARKLEDVRAVLMRRDFVGFSAVTASTQEGSSSLLTALRSIARCLAAMIGFRHVWEVHGSSVLEPSRRVLAAAHR